MGDTTQALVPSESQLPEAVSRRGVNEAQWRTIVNNLYPGAKVASVLMVLDYCKARGLDPMKKPCHIVPMEVHVSSTNTYEWRDVVMPGIYEYRTTAHRTGEYMGHSKPEYGPDFSYANVTVPEWCEMTVYRWNVKSQQKGEYPVRTYFKEVVALKKDKQSGQFRVNARWSRAPNQMLTKCCEAAALREAFPEELGGTMTEEEMDGQRAINIDPTREETPPKVLAIFDTLPEPVQDNINKAFTELGFTRSQALQKMNEYLAGNLTPDDGATKLLAWCVNESATRKTSKPRAASNSNKKAPAVTPTPTTAPPVEPESPTGSDRAVAEAAEPLTWE